jgi:hypothetical protein
MPPRVGSRIGNWVRGNSDGSPIAPECPRSPCSSRLRRGCALNGPPCAPLDGRNPCVQARSRPGAPIPFLGARKTRAAFRTSRLLTDRQGGRRGRLRTGRPGGLADGDGAGAPRLACVGVSPSGRPCGEPVLSPPPRVPAIPVFKPFLARGARSAPPFRPPRVAAIPVFKPDLGLVRRFPFWGRGRHELRFPHREPPLGGPDRPRRVCAGRVKPLARRALLWRNRAPSTDLRALFARAVPRKACVHAVPRAGAQCVRPCAPPSWAAIVVFMPFPVGRKAPLFGA